MLNLELIKNKARKEIGETKTKVVTSFVELIENEIYKEIKKDIAVNDDFSLKEYCFTLPFNPRRDSGFDTFRSNEHGMTIKELIEEIKLSLEKEGYECEILADEHNGEQSILKTKLIIK